MNLSREADDMGGELAEAETTAATEVGEPVPLRVPEAEEISLPMDTRGEERARERGREM